MKANRWALTLLLIPTLLLSACSGASLSLDLPALSSRLTSLQSPTATAAATAAPSSGTTGAAALPSTNLPNLDELQSVFEQIYQNVNPSVVNIQVTETGSSNFGGQGGGSALGSGFVWDQQGHIVTNAHVVDGASSISVTFADGTVADAQLVGADRYSDLAVIKVDVPSADLHPVQLADSTQVKVGQIVIAIGNPFGLQGTMTQGIISGLSRTLPVETNSSLNQQSLNQQSGRYSIPDIIQTDASINPGNSGGVLVDDAGKVVGVTSAIASSTDSSSGVGFVIPASIVQKIVPALIKSGKVQHSWMGVGGTTLTPDLARSANLPEDQQGVLVLTVASGGPAAKAGLRGGSSQASVGSDTLPVGGDVITAIDGQTVKRFEDMVSYLYNQTDPGQKVSLTILRQGKQQNLQLTLGVLPDTQ